MLQLAGKLHGRMNIQQETTRKNFCQKSAKKEGKRRFFFQEAQQSKTSADHRELHNLIYVFLNKWYRRL